MKKLSRAISILLLAVMVAGVLSACSLFGINASKYRSETAFTVGKQSVSIGKVIDTFNNYYNSYYSYVSQGYFTADSLFSMAMSSLYTQYMKLDAYVDANQAVNSNYKGGYKYGEYLTEDELAYIAEYVTYLIFTNYDSAVEDEINKNYTLEDAEEADTSRDFTEHVDLGGATTYSAYERAQLFVNEDMTEYFDDYYRTTGSTRIENPSKYLSSLEAKANDYCERLTEYKDIEDATEQSTFKANFRTEFAAWQQKVQKRYNSSIETSYGITFDEFFKNQVEDAIVSMLVSLYDNSVAAATENYEGLAAALSTLKTNAANDRAAQKAQFAIKENFTTVVEGLSDGTYIYDVPAGYEYIFVKNILVPFSDEQKTELSNLEKQLGTTDCDEYKAYREQLAASIVADDFLTDKDADGNYGKVENLFKYESNKLVVNPDGELGNYFKADGTVTAMANKSKDETVVELMKRFNTDTAQHTAAYDYVVRINAPADYTAQWVTEFVDAAEDAKAVGENGYGICVSTYGVHIVYYVKDVTATVFNFESADIGSTPDLTSDSVKATLDTFLAKCLADTASAEYKLFTAYYSNQATSLKETAVEELEEAYFNTVDDDGNIEHEGKISFTDEFKSFLDDQGLTFDYTASIAHEHE